MLPPQTFGLLGIAPNYMDRVPTLLFPTLSLGLRLYRPGDFTPTHLLSPSPYQPAQCQLSSQGEVPTLANVVDVSRRCSPLCLH